MSWIDLVGWITIGFVSASFLVIVLTVWFVERGPHQDECQHGVDIEDYPECRFGQ